jgi:hypothetical protein
VCKEFRRLGHEAYSNDIIECSGGHPEWHLQMDVFIAVELDSWDLMIAHPPCTYLTNSGVCWLYKEDGRWGKMWEGAKFFKDLCEVDIPKIAVENPIPHKYAMAGMGSKYTQVIQPWMFGHGETKATCLWLKNLPKLIPTDVVEGRVQRLHYLPPSPERSKLRSKTYEGIAKAMAEQWGEK